MITKEESLQAIKISQALQAHFDSNGAGKILRSDDAYEILINKKLVERDRHNGIKFRDFLLKLNRFEQLYLIPQCQPENGFNNTIKWYFKSEPNKTIKAKNLVPIEKITLKAQFKPEEIKEKVKLFPKIDETKLTKVQLEIRKNYSRSYEFWTKNEEELLLEVVKLNTDINALSEVFSRQPSAIKSRLREKFNIEL